MDCAASKVARIVHVLSDQHNQFDSDSNHYYGCPKVKPSVKSRPGFFKVVQRPLKS
jgi:hypothetical protein